MAHCYMLREMSMTFPRQLANEILDNLAKDDPRAIRARQDLRRINRFIGSAGTITRTLCGSRRVPKRIIELGAGDGDLIMRMAWRLFARWPGVQVTLLDRHDLIDGATRDGFRRVGWNAEVLRMDVADWLAQPSAQYWDICIANLFIHHFDTEQIATLFDVLTTRTDMVIACEPRRGMFPLMASRLVGMLGASAVTRKDAVLSVQAGFCGKELSALWPSTTWQLDEGPARLFSHLLVATRKAG